MSPRNEDQNQRIRDERREQILQAALTVFAQKGWAVAKIGDVAKEAGLSHGLVYHYFASKDEIFTELVRQALEMSTEIFIQGAAQPGTPWDRLTAMTETVIPNAYRGTSPYYFLIMIQAFTSEAVPAEVKKVVKELAPRYVESLVPVLIEGQKMGEVADGDPQKMATAYFAMIQGLAIARIQSGDDLLLPEPEMILRLFKGDQPLMTGSMPPVESPAFIFQPVMLGLTRLLYRSTSVEVGSTEQHYEVTMETVSQEGQEVLRIKSCNNHQEMTAYVRPDWRPVLIETRAKSGELVARITYEADSATFESSGKERKKIKVRGDFFDSNTLFQFLGGYPFDSKEKVIFDMVMDGKGGSPIGSFKMSVQKIGREEIHIPAGNFDCYKLEMGMAGIAAAFASRYRSNFWYTAEAPHLLVRYEDSMGRVTELTSSM